MKEKPTETVRLDKWLWAVCFYKPARGRRGEMIEGGKVHYNGQRSKPENRRTRRHADAAPWQRRADGAHIGITEQRRPASEAVNLYEETAESIEKRENGPWCAKMNALTMCRTLTDVRSRKSAAT